MQPDIRHSQPRHEATEVERQAVGVDGNWQPKASWNISVYDHPLYESPARSW
jgi:hypothetical protein